jgi:thiaminase/transcriptional activator TenA
MATGTLGESLFRNYMIQDYLYLLEYIEILRQIRELAKEAALRDFIQNVISETEMRLTASISRR